MTVAVLVRYSRYSRSLCHVYLLATQPRLCWTSTVALVSEQSTPADVSTQPSSCRVGLLHDESLVAYGTECT